MPILVKFLLAIFVFWTLIYNASYCAFQFKKKNLKSALSIAALSILLVLTFGLSMMTM